MHPGQVAPALIFGVEVLWSLCGPDLGKLAGDALTSASNSQIAGEQPGGTESGYSEEAQDRLDET
jgi:hypothetical protein